MKTKQTYSTMAIFALLLLVSLNASSFISYKNVLAAKTLKVAELKNSANYSGDLFPDRAPIAIECTVYILINLDRGEVFYCESETEAQRIAAEYPTEPSDTKGWSLNINEGYKITCMIAGNGCTPTFCTP